jgi:hypothetical protein
MNQNQRLAKILIAGFVASISLLAFSQPQIDGIAIDPDSEVTLSFGTNPLRLYQIQSSTNLLDWVSESDIKSYGELTLADWTKRSSDGTRFYRLQEITPTGEMETLYSDGTNSHQTVISTELSTVPVGYSTPVQSAVLYSALAVPMEISSESTTVEIKSTFGISDSDNNTVYDTLFREDVCMLPDENRIRLYSIAEKTTSNTTVTVNFTSSKNGISKQASYACLYTNQWVGSLTLFTQTELKGFAESCLPSLIGVENNAVAIDFPKTAVTHVDNIDFLGEMEILNPDPQIVWHFEQLVAEMIFNMDSGKLDIDLLPGSVTIDWSALLNIIRSKMVEYGGAEDGMIRITNTLEEFGLIDWIIKGEKTVQGTYTGDVERKTYQLEPAKKYLLNISFEGETPAQGAVVGRVKKDIIVPDYGTLSSTKSSITESMEEGESPPVASFVVSYNGDFQTTLNFSCPADWLTVDATPTSSRWTSEGTIPGREYEVLLWFDEDLSAGTYNTTLSVNSPYCQNSPLQIAISLVVDPVDEWGLYDDFNSGLINSNLWMFPSHHFVPIVSNEELVFESTFAGDDLNSYAVVTKEDVRGIRAKLRVGNSTVSEDGGGIELMAGDVESSSPFYQCQFKLECHNGNLSLYAAIQQSGGEIIWQVSEPASFSTVYDLSLVVDDANRAQFYKDGQLFASSDIMTRPMTAFTVGSWNNGPGDVVAFADDIYILTEDIDPTVWDVSGIWSFDIQGADAIRATVNLTQDTNFITGTAIDSTSLSYDITGNMQNDFITLNLTNTSFGIGVQCTGTGSGDSMSGDFTASDGNTGTWGGTKNN